MARAAINSRGSSGRCWLDEMRRRALRCVVEPTTCCRSKQTTFACRPSREQSLPPSREPLSRPLRSSAPATAASLACRSRARRRRRTQMFGARYGRLRLACARCSRSTVSIAARRCACECEAHRGIGTHLRSIEYGIDTTAKAGAEGRRDLERVRRCCRPRSSAADSASGSPVGSARALYHVLFLRFCVTISKLLRSPRRNSTRAAMLVL